MARLPMIRFQRKPSNRNGRTYEPGMPSRLGGSRSFCSIRARAFETCGGYVGGLTTSEEHFRSAVEQEDLPSLHRFRRSVFRVPGCLRQRYRPWNRPRRISNALPPAKEFVLIPNEGHDAMATRSDELLKLLDKWVQPRATRYR